MSGFFSNQLIRVSVVNSQGSFRANVCCDFMCTTKGSVANQPFPYSDHEAVTAHLRLKARTTADMVSESPNSSAGMLHPVPARAQSQGNTPPSEGDYTL